MRYTFSFAVFLYAAAAIIDAIVGISTLNQLESYLFKFAAAAAILATYIYLTSKSKPLRSLPFILASLMLSIIPVMYGRRDMIIPVNAALKVAAIALTLKPEIIEVEIITEDEEESKSTHETANPENIKPNK